MFVGVLNWVIASVLLSNGLMPEMWRCGDQESQPVFS